MTSVRIGLYQWGRRLVGSPNTAARLAGWRRATQHGEDIVRHGRSMPPTMADQTICPYLGLIKTSSRATSRKEGMAWYSSRPMPSLWPLPSSMVSADVSWRGRDECLGGCLTVLCVTILYILCMLYITLSESKKLVINLKSKYKTESQSCTHLGSSLGESEAKISNIYREGGHPPLHPEARVLWVLPS